MPRLPCKADQRWKPLFAGYYNSLIIKLCNYFLLRGIRRILVSYRLSSLPLYYYFLLASDSGGVSVSELVRVVKEVSLSRTEIQILTDALLNKQHDPLPEHSEWTEVSSCFLSTQTIKILMNSSSI